ncbi:MAG: hypothetical protein RL693_1070 [Verrucomicrobiota bacterium]|jgi:predicted nucleic-acid-binding protein
MNATGLSLDTSVVLRLLVQEPLPLFHLAAQFVEAQLEGKVPVHVSDLVLAEAYFALQSFYQLPKADALKAIGSFVQTSGVTVTPTARDVLATPHLATVKPGFVDRLIHGACHEANQTLVTFEKAAKKLPDTVVL